MVMNIGINHLRPHVHTQFADCENPQCVSHHSKRDNKEYKDRSLPKCAEKKVTREQTRKKQNQTRMNSATFRCYFDRDAWQLKHEGMIKYGCAGHMKQRQGGSSRS